MVQHAIIELVTKTMEKFVMQGLGFCIIVAMSFDLWMYKSGHDTFALVINFINSHWVPCHVAMGLFEDIDTFEIAMVAQLKQLLLFYNLLDKLITYMKDEGGNLSTLARVLSSMVSCVPWKLTTPWQGSCFGHVFSKTCQYVHNAQQYVLAFERSA
jgi:hypothetical protein